MTAKFKLRRKKAPRNTNGTKKRIINGLYAIWYMTIISDHPSMVTHWNTLRSAQKMLSKLVTS